MQKVVGSNPIIRSPPERAFPDPRLALEHEDVRLAGRIQEEVRERRQLLVAADDLPPIRPSDESVPQYLSGERTGAATCCRKRLTGGGTRVITGEEVWTIRLLRGVGTR